MLIDTKIAILFMFAFLFTLFIILVIAYNLYQNAPPPSPTQIQNNISN
jgi:hypothetical protein